MAKPDVLGPHDLVGRALLEHAVLMDAGLVGERVAADDRLVALHLHAGDVRHQPAGGHQPLRVDPRVGSGSNRCAVRMAITTSSSEQLPARSPMPLIVHSICPAPFSTPARLLATARPRSLWQCTLITALSMFGTRSRSVRITLPHVRRRGVADGVGNVDRRGAGVDGRFDHLAEKIGLGAGGVFGRELDVVAVADGPLHARARRGAMISSLSILSLNSRWMALVARKT